MKTLTNDEIANIAGGVQNDETTTVDNKESGVLQSIAATLGTYSLNDAVWDSVYG